MRPRTLAFSLLLAVPIPASASVGPFPPVALAAQVGVTLATWDEEIAPAMTFKNTLIYRDGVVVLQTRYHDGSTSAYEVAERPADSPSERRFDLEPDSDRSEYITLTDAGVVKYFDWAGQQFRVAFTTRIHADFLTVGANPVSVACVPKELSPASKQIVALYEQLLSFKDDQEFVAAGFGGSYRPWLEAAQRLRDAAPAAESLDQLGFLAGDVMILGMDYASAGGGRLSRGAQDMKETILAGIALATCHAATQ